MSNGVPLFAITAVICLLSGGMTLAAHEHLNRAGLRLGGEALGVPIKDLRVERISAPMFQRWGLWRLDDQMIPPRAMSIAAREDRAVVITWEGGLEDILPDEAMPETPEAAISLIELFVAMTRPYAMLLRSAADIPGIDRLNAGQLAVAPPRAHRKGVDFAVQAGLWEHGVLERVDFEITPRRINPHVSVLQKAVGVAITVE